MVGKGELIGHVNNVASYTVLYDSANILCRGSLGSSIIKRIRLIREEAKNYAYRYFKTIKEGVNLALHVWVVIEHVVVKVT